MKKQVRVSEEKIAIMSFAGDKVIPNAANEESRSVVSLIPSGYESISHPIFASFEAPLSSAVRNTGGVSFVCASKGRDGNGMMGLGTLKGRGADNHFDKHHENTNNSQLERSPSSESKGNSETADTGGTAKQCAICLNHFQDPVTIVTCLHSFCRICISHWFEVSATCPLCKTAEVDFIRNAEQGDFVRIELWKYSRHGTKKRRKRQKTSSAQIMAAVKEYRKRFRPAKSSVS